MLHDPLTHQSSAFQRPNEQPGESKNVGPKEVMETSVVYLRKKEVACQATGELRLPTSLSNTYTFGPHRR